MVHGLIAVVVAAATVTAFAAAQPETPPTEAPAERRGEPQDLTRPDNPAPAPSALPEPDLPGTRRAPASGEDVLVVMKSEGERFEAQFVSDDGKSLRVRIAGIVVSIVRESVERLVVLDPPLDRYRQMRALIADSDLDRLVLLAQWLQRRRLYAEAVRELEHVLGRDPTHGEAIRLHREVEQQAALAGRTRQEPENPPAPTERPPAPTRPRPGDFPLLSPEQINLMKVYEVDLSNPPRLVIGRETIQRLLTQYADDPLIPATRDGRARFMSKPPQEILDLMFRLRARDLYAEVQVLDQPESMRLFRDHVHAAWLVNTCATTRCHGGSQAGRLQLTNYRPTSDASVYTNFLILERFVTKDGQRLINYEEPEKSVLLQMSLPRDDSSAPHPDVPGWRPAFRNRNERRFEQAVEWIRSMYRPRPEFPIEYSPPGERADSDAPHSPPEKPVER